MLALNVIPCGYRSADAIKMLSNGIRVVTDIITVSITIGYNIRTESTENFNQLGCMLRQTRKPRRQHLNINIIHLLTPGYLYDRWLLHTWLPVRSIITACNVMCNRTSTLNATQLTALTKTEHILDASPLEAPLLKAVPQLQTSTVCPVYLHYCCVVDATQNWLTQAWNHSHTDSTWYAGQVSIRVKPPPYGVT